MRADSDIRVRAGLLRHPVTIQSEQALSPPQYGPAGGPLLAWGDVLVNVRAQIQPARATQVVRGGQIVNEMVVPIAMRFAPQVIPGMRVKFYNPATGNTNYYLITGLNNLDERNWQVELQTLALGTNL